jgi:hypothetical protein
LAALALAANELALIDRRRTLLNIVAYRPFFACTLVEKTSGNLFWLSKKAKNRTRLWRTG